MFLYLSWIIGTNIFIIGLSFFLKYLIHLIDYANLTIIFIPILATILIIAIDGLFATIIRRCLPNKMFSYKVGFHKVSKFEIKIYEKLGVKNWKDDVLELGMFTDFSKRKVEKPEDRTYIERFILESNYGAAIHFFSLIYSIPLFFIFPSKFTLLVITPVFIVNALLNILPFIILRYNLVRLHRLRNLLEKKEERALLQSK